VTKGLTFALAIAAMAALPADLAKAGYWYRPYDFLASVAVLPPDDILSTVRFMGFYPTTEAVLRGPYYVLHANDPRGIEMRIVADAQFGDILSIEPALVLDQVYPLFYYRGPLIIHVPPDNGRNQERQRG